LARDLIRTVQIARRDAGLHVADHIRLLLDPDGEGGAAVAAHRRYLMEQTLADELELGSLDGSGLDYQARHEVGRGGSVGIGLSRIG
jgi:isoleucyl-tRNA synthetase